MDRSKNALKTSSVTERLVSLITDLPEGQQRALLERLELRLSKERRRHPRKPLSTIADFVAEERGYREFTKNISEGGMFIETSMPFSVGQEVSITFAFPHDQRPIKISGEIIRVEDSGIGIQFLINSLVEALSITTQLKRI